MPLKIVNGDICLMKVDAVVNAANTSLCQGGGVCGAIFTAANDKRLEEDCRKIGHCDTGNAIITKGYGLKAKHIIHAVGPIWQAGQHNEEELLESAYKNSLQIAMNNGCRSVAFPLISSGIYAYPKDKAFEIAVCAIEKFLKKQDIMVYLVLFDE